MPVHSDLDRLHQELKSIRASLEAAEALVSRLMEINENEDRADSGATTESQATRDPSLFRGDGPHLSEKGVKTIQDMFRAGYTIEQAAAKLGISVSAAASRRREWKRLAV